VERGHSVSTTCPHLVPFRCRSCEWCHHREGHPLEGKKITGCVLAFPYGKGSTVGSYVLYALSRRGIAPAAILNTEAEPIIAVGAIIGGIPMADRPSIPLERLQDGTVMRVNGTTGEIEYEGELLPPGGPSPTGRQGEN